MGMTYYAELIDSPPFTLDIDALTAAWNQAHPDMEAFPEADPYNRDAYQLIGDVLSIDKNGLVSARDVDLFVLFLEFYRDYLPAEYKLMVFEGGPDGPMSIEKGFKQDDFFAFEPWTFLPREYNVHVFPGHHYSAAPDTHQANPLADVTGYEFRVDARLLRRSLKAKLPKAILRKSWSWDEGNYSLGYRTARCRMHLLSQTLVITDTNPDSTWELLQWYREMIPLEHRLHLTITSAEMLETEMLDANTRYERSMHHHISRIPYPTRSSLPKEDLVAMLRKVTGVQQVIQDDSHENTQSE